MRALAFILLLVGTSLTGTGETLERAIQALIQVESNGRSSEIGDNGKAYGILQIHDVMIQDYNRITGASLKHSDAFDEQTARAVCRSVIIYYLQDIDNPTLKLFGGLISTGTINSLQGYYQRTARDLVETGYLSNEGDVL